MIVHRETPNNRHNTWGVLCGQWAPAGKLVTKKDSKTTCQKCLAVIARIKEQEAEEARQKQSMRGIYKMRP
jgi:hypothetical protein